MRLWLLVIALTGCERGPREPGPPAQAPAAGSRCSTDADCVAIQSSGCGCKECDVKCRRTELRGTCREGVCSALVPVPERVIPRAKP